MSSSSSSNELKRKSPASEVEQQAQEKKPCFEHPMMILMGAGKQLARIHLRPGTHVTREGVDLWMDTFGFYTQNKKKQLAEWVAGGMQMELRDTDNTLLHTWKIDPSTGISQDKGFFVYSQSYGEKKKRTLAGSLNSSIHVSLEYVQSVEPLKKIIYWCSAANFQCNIDNFEDSVTRAKSACEYAEQQLKIATDTRDKGVAAVNAILAFLQ